MSQPIADRNLIFGILAMQMDFITREQLIAAMQAWVFDKSKSLGDILCGHRALDKENQALLDALVQKHLAKHDNDAEKSLAAIAPASNLRADLQQIADVDVQASLVRIPSRPADPYATIAPSPKQAAAATGLRFRVVRPHARGGLGEVFIALDEELHREVALKEIQDRQADNQESRARFMLEAEITGGLEHPGIVPVYGLGSYPDGRPYYAMRFIRGDSLKDAVEKYHRNVSKMSAGERALELRNLLGRFVDVCNAIAYAHSRGVLHRDLKPGNIMLGKYGETLVVDWGLAKPLGQVTKGEESLEPGEGSLMPSSLSAASATLVGSAVGTPQYMSPEQAGGRLDQLGPPSDVYSLGATMYCILTGKPPIGDTDVGTVLQKVQRGDFPRPREVQADIPPALEAICLKAMSVKPTERYQSPRGLADDVEHWLADEPVTAWKEPWTERARRWIGRHATLVTGAVSAVVVALIGLIVATILLTAANERERQAKQKADENYKLAKAAVDRYHTKVSEDDLLKEPGMQPLRKKLLEAAAEFYEKLATEKADDPNMRGEVGKAKFRLAQITADIDSRPKAIALHKEAAAIFETLSASERKPDIQVDQASTYHHLGRLLRMTGQAKDADDYYDKALKVWETLVEANPKERATQAGLARTLMGIGNAQQNMRRLDKAQNTYEKSIKVWSELARTNAAAEEYQREIGVNYSNLGMIYQAIAGKEKEAEKALRAAWVIQKKLAEDSPNISQYQDDYARTNYNLGRAAYASADAKADARPFYEEAATRWQALVNQHPAVTDFHKRLAEAYMDLAQLHRANGDMKEAETACDKALIVHRKLVAKHKDDDTYLSILARGLTTLGEVCTANREFDRAKDAESAFFEAITIQEKLANKASAPPDYQRDLAKTYISLGNLQAARDRDEKAADAYKNAVQWWEKLVRDHPNEYEYTIGLSHSCYFLGTLAKTAGNFKGAQPWFTRAVKCFDGMNVSALSNAQVKMAMWYAYQGRGETYTKLGLHSDALDDWNRAFDLSRPENRRLVILPRAAAMARMGNHVEAIREVSPLVNEAKTGPSLFYFARIYALSAGAAKDQKSLADEYANQAIKFLAAARGAKYFDSLNNQKKLILEADLQAVRDHPGFQKLTSEYKLQ